jgi:hypothetical protein
MHTLVLRASIMALTALLLGACASQNRDFGRYRIAIVEDGFGGLICQPRQEFYFFQRARDNAEATYLGTCGTPNFVTDHMKMPSDPSCFAISADGESIVYYHRPEVCGAGDKAKRKPSGLYLHSAVAGERLLYPESEFSQVWSNEALPPGAMRIMWIARTSSRTGAKCAQTIVVYASGSEEVLGRPDPTSPMCKLR